MLYSQKIWSNLRKLKVKRGENTKNHPGMSIAKITEAFKDKRFVRHEFFTMNVYRNRYAKI